MAKNMQVILLEDIAALGRAGDIIAVSEGYARNFLFPQGKAAQATENVRHEHDQRVKKAEQDRQEQIKVLQQQAEQLDGTELVITARVKENSNKIFGRITASTIAAQLAEQAKIDCAAKNIKFKKPIIEIGECDVPIDLGLGVEIVIHVRVVPEDSDTSKSKKK